MNTKKRDTIELILWVVAVVGMLVLLLAIGELRELSKSASDFRTITNRK
jgi:type IV secretory pathway TrbD component